MPDKTPKDAQSAPQTSQPGAEQHPQAENNGAAGQKKRSSPLARRKLWRRLRWALWLVLAVPFVYFAVQIFIILAPRMRTEVVMMDTMTDSITVTGQVVLNSQPVSGGGEHLYYTVPAGQRVNAGTDVAMLFPSQAALQAMGNLAATERELELLQEAQRTATDGRDLDNLLGQMHEGLQDLILLTQSGDYSAMLDAKNAIALAANKIQISTGETASFESRIRYLEALRLQYMEMAQPTATVVAPEGGYFTPSPRHDAVMMDYDTAKALDAEGWQQALQRPAQYYGEDVVGHVITDYKWRFFTVVSARQAEKFIVGDKSLHIAFPDAGDASLPVVVESVTLDEAAGLAVVELYCEYLSPEVLNLRTEKAQIIFGVEKGIRIDKNALRLVNVENEDGSVTTLRGVYVKFGNMVYFRRVEILLEDEFYMLVSPVVRQGVNEVELYDTVVVDAGGVELYDRKIL
ncbi:hypothetical protein LJC04_00810 [Ruminococcaceae bacterium OttesenSCG-928-O06]|nr:hypothetical protein [Ruminococcaceae bacterium OttesenSCG-928-O06]